MRAAHLSLVRSRSPAYLGAALLLAFAFVMSPAAHARVPVVPVRIVLYEGYGTPEAVVLRGRVVEDVADPAASPSPDRPALANAARNVRMFETDEVLDLPIRLRFDGRAFKARTDDDGLFEVTVRPKGRPFAVGRHTIEAILDPTVERFVAATSRGPVFVIAHEPSVIVLSDFDDTLVETFNRNKARLVQEVLLKNAAQLSPVEGGPEMMRRAMDAGAGALFVVSGSPLALFERIGAFLDGNHYPERAVFLKNLGKERLFSQQGYKLTRILGLMERFPEHAFILIGDSGQEDPEIYAELRRRRPEQVRAIIIRRAGNPKDGPERFDNMIVVDDYRDQPDLIADLVAPPTPHR